MTGTTLETSYANVTSPASNVAFSPTANWQYFVYPPPTAGYHVSTTCTPTYLGDQAPMLLVSGETCIMTASSVQLLYWPTPYATPSPTTTITPGPSLATSVGPDGFTYTSPSVYVIYYSLQAFNEMGKSQGGSTYDSLTIAYDPTELSTLYGCSQTVLSTKALDYQDFNMPPRWSVLSQHQRCDTCGQVYQFPGSPHPGDEIVSNYANMTYAYNAMVDGVASWRLHPEFVLPPSLNDQDPHWKGCVGFTWGVFDPPRTMAAAPAMMAPSPNSAPSSTPVTTTATAGEPAKPVPLPPDPGSVQTPVPGSSKQDPSLDTEPNVAPPSPDPSQDPSVSKQDDPPDPDSNGGAPASDPLQDPKVNKQNDQSSPKPSVFTPPASYPSQYPAATISSVPPAAALVTIAGHTIAAHPSGGVAVDGNHVQAGNSEIITNGVRIAQNEAGIVIGGNTIQVPSTPTTGPFTSINGQGVEKDNGGGVVVGGSTIASGATASIGNIQVSVGDGSIRVLPTAVPYVPINVPAASPLPTPPVTDDENPSSKVPDTNGVSNGELNGGNIPQGPTSPALGIFAAGQTWTPLNHDTLIANGATISIGGPALTTAGTTVSMGDMGLVAGSSTIAIPGVGPQSTTVAGAPAGVFTAAGQTFTPLADNKLLVNGKTTLDTGAPLTTVAGVIMSLGSSLLVIGTSTIRLSNPAAPSPPPTPLTAAGKTFTPIGSNMVVAGDGTTLSIGGAALNSNGTVISLASGGLIVGGSTTMPVRATASVGLGGVIMSGFGPGASTGPEIFEGVAAAKRSGSAWLLVLGVICPLVGARWLLAL